MSDQERLTILEMEFALVSARLNTVDAQLAIVRKGVEDTRRDTHSIDERTERIERMMETVVRHLGLE